MAVVDDLSLGLDLLDADSFLCFESFSHCRDSNTVSFFFHYCGGKRFGATLKLPPRFLADVVDDVEGVLFHIGLCVLPWYWMGYACKRIRIQAGYLDTHQVSFWHTFYQNVLSEFLFLHNLDRDRLHIEVDTTRAPCPVISKRRLQDPHHVLVPLGGGKDSLTVFAMLQDGSIPATWFYVGDHDDEFQESWRLQAILRHSKRPCHALEFSFSANADAFEKEVAGLPYAPCGHPWAALVCFASVLAALDGGYRYIAVGNERSANFGNHVTYHGVVVNHQYDKSFEFEQLVHAYLTQYVVADIYYFSALQPLWEVQIVQEFCRHPAYLPLFLSCNEPDTHRWCAKCAKCAFVFLLLSAWLPPPAVWAVFGSNLLEHKSIAPIFDSLLGWHATDSLKPMECVGTSDETFLSLVLAHAAYVALDNATLPYYLRLPHVQDAIETRAPPLYLLTDVNADHLIPSFLHAALHVTPPSS
ncbi:Aste57867_225 [Aphanomyces stellatus]|uniref:Aste57867_225 protein n=1 Tax=Aphanomyces stellatus TaxID=120398 RepID=A0A485K351_9STRA|nr:hypothetical protein As57867_000225 [Aphanomyces stellatus]VFT77451.1 Aste57867_225 [Aphanomyces stellatus]